jgi:hypothetical protein
MRDRLSAGDAAREAQCLPMDGMVGSTDREERGIKGIRGESAVAFLRSEIQRLSEIRQRG